MKRILLFVLTNVAVMAVLLITTRLLGVDRFLTANGLNMGALAWRCHHFAADEQANGQVVHPRFYVDQPAAQCR